MSVTLYVSPLPAAGARVEVQVDGIAGRGDTYKVTDIDSQPLGRASNVHVICLYRKIQFVGLIQHVLAKSFIRLILAVHTACNFFHVRLQLEVVDINRGEHDAETEQRDRKSTR